MKSLFFSIGNGIHPQMVDFSLVLLIQPVVARNADDAGLLGNQGPEACIETIVTCQLSFQQISQRTEF